MVRCHGAIPGGTTQNEGIRPIDGELGATLGEVEDEDKSPVAVLEDTVGRMQRDLEEL